MGKKERIAELLQIIEDATAEIKSLIDKDDDGAVANTVPPNPPPNPPGGGNP